MGMEIPERKSPVAELSPAGRDFGLGLIARLLISHVFLELLRLIEHVVRLDTGNSGGEAKAFQAKSFFGFHFTITSSGLLIKASADRNPCNKKEGAAGPRHKRVHPGFSRNSGKSADQGSKKSKYQNCEQENDRTGKNSVIGSVLETFQVDVKNPILGVYTKGHLRMVSSWRTLLRVLGRAIRPPNLASLVEPGCIRCRPCCRRQALREGQR